MEAASNIPMLVIGHVTRDRFADEVRLGGPAAYVARALSGCGQHVALVTRAPDEPLLAPLAADPRIALHRLASDTLTTFCHHGVAGERRLRLEACADAIAMQDIPRHWTDLPWVFLVPVMGECSAEMLTAFAGSSIVAGAQGWLRAAGEQGWIESCAPPQSVLTARLAAVTLSQEDHPQAESLCRRMAGNSRIAVLTRGHRPISAYEADGQSDIDVEAIEAHRDTVGAGDVLTALLGLRLAAGDMPKKAVEAAARGAALFVAGGMTGLRAFPCEPAAGDR